LSFVAREKVRKEKGMDPLVKTLILMVAAAVSGGSAFAEEAVDKTHTQLPVSIGGLPAGEFYTLLVVLGLELVVIFMLSAYIQMLIRVIRNQPEIKAKVVAKKSWFWDKFNKAASLEKEQDILLDHNYDGIQELDNSLPPWWIYGFYLTIFVSVIYIYRYHISHDGASQQEEFVAEMQKGEEEKAEYLAKSANNVDENTVVFMGDAAELAQGKDLFIKACVACHLADGGGSVGPNLTDEYWLHGGGIKDVFKSIKYGWQDKGMKSWKDDYSPKQIQQLASFVASLKGTHPAAPKAPQGDIYITATTVTVATDTTGK
jgi:cytochrome c oxidase cbb3-type subunit 3